MSTMEESKGGCKLEKQMSILRYWSYNFISGSLMNSISVSVLNHCILRVLWEEDGELELGVQEIY
jgi:hypothetical protein